MHIREIIQHYLQAERFSAKEVIHENIRTGDALHKLEQLMNDVFTRRADRIAPIP
jgi:mediator of RNA polymerase II transcription subunit 12